MIQPNVYRTLLVMPNGAAYVLKQDKRRRRRPNTGMSSGVWLVDKDAAADYAKKTGCSLIVRPVLWRRQSGSS